MIPVTLILLAGLLAVALLRRWPAAARHWILTATIVCALAMPMLQRVAPSWLEAARFRLPHASAPLTLFVTLPDVAVDNGVVAVAGRATERPVASGAFWFVLVWIVGSALTAMFLLTGIARVRWLVRRSTEVIDGPWRETADALTAQLGIGRRVRVLISEHPRVLITWGWRRAVVLLPASAAHWPAERVRVVLAHELAHVRRRDWLALMAGELLRCAHWFNPAVWASCRTLRREGELACDDEVLNLGVDASIYAEHLLDLARTLRPRGAWSDRFLAPAMARPSTLERRIRAMLNSRLDRGPNSRAVSVGAVLLVAALALPVAALFASGQNTGAGASFEGALLDAVGRTMPDVPVVLVNSQTQQRSESRTDPSGRFSFVNLAAGDYQIKVEQPGFKLWQARVTIGSGDAVQRDIALQLGEVHETVTVRALADASAPPPPPLPPPPPPVSGADAGADPCGPSPAGGCIAPPRKLKDVRPTYPEQPRLAGLGATVKVDAVIGTDGRVRGARPIVSADPEFVAAAIDAISRWQFTPTRVAGVPVETKMIVTVNFESIR